MRYHQVLYTMSSYAKINQDNIVENVIIADSSFISTQSGKWIEVTEATKKANSGDTYDEVNNKFISQKPFESWVLDEESFEWVSPVGEKPSTGYWSWNEADQIWEEIISELSE